MVTRIASSLPCALALTGCPSATAFRVDRSDMIGPCQTAVPDRNVLLGVALSGGGSRAALFGEAGLEALARLRTADRASVIDYCQDFVFIRGVFAGTLSPQAMDSRTDGALGRVFLQSGRLTAEYARYAVSDPLCCPTRTTSVVFDIVSDAPVVRPVSASASTR